jgi:glucose/arabinose dehydrogenase
MTHKFLKVALFPAAVLVASCAAAAVGDSAGQPVALDASSPFTASSFGAFAEPWALAFEPGTGVIFITEKAGTARFVDPATGRTGTVTGMPQVAYGGQGGLGDFAFAPDYATSRAVYISWAQAAEGTARRAVVARGQLVCEAADACEVTGLTEVWRQEPAIDSPGHFSHKITFSPDGAHMFISSGERMQGDPAQDLGSNLGKIVRLNLDGTPAAGNPFSDRPSPTNQIWSYGHRNVYGLHFDAGGQLWDLEHGPRGGDELNRVTQANNYGWPVRSNGNDYDGDNIPDHSADDGFTKPAISWNPVIAPGDFVFYHGSLFADWQGQALIANLGSQTIVRVATDAAAGTASEDAAPPARHC